MKNNKGFALTEVLVLAVFLVSTLIVVFVEYRAVTNGYKTVFTYNTVSALYKAENLRTFLTQDSYDDLIEELSGNSTHYVMLVDNATRQSDTCLSASTCSHVTNTTYCNQLVSNLNLRQAIFTNEDTTSLINALSTDTSLDTSMKNFIEYTVSDGEADRYRLFIETCDGELATIKMDGSSYELYLLGDSEVYLADSASYTEPGYYVVDKAGNTIQNDSRVNVSGTIGSSDDFYTLTYSLYINGEIEATAFRTISRYTTINNFAYTGGVQSYLVRRSGYYQLEAYGAAGGHGYYKTYPQPSDNKGAYTSGAIYLEEGTTIYIYVGGAGGSATSASAGGTGGYNGGGAGGKDNSSNANDAAGGGGGATDFRLVGGTWNNATSLASRIMVAAGGGGTHTTYNSSSAVADYTMGTIGGSLVSRSYLTTWKINWNARVSQTAGGAFGYGSTGISAQNAGGGGGGGYYGGYSQSDGTYAGRGAGGSSFISGYAGVNAITSATSTTATNNTIHYSGKYFINGVMVAGGNTAATNGSAKVTFLGASLDTFATRDTRYNWVRYIKDCMNGSISGSTPITTSSSWNEIEAISNGLNVALNHSVTATATVYSGSGGTWSLGALVDGDLFHNSIYGVNNSNLYLATTGLQCVTIDLGETYNLDELVVWHFWDFEGTARHSRYHTLSVSSDNTTWTTIVDNASNELEGIIGLRYHAYTFN